MGFLEVLRQTQEVIRREASLGDHGPQRRSMNLQDGFSNRGGEGEARKFPVEGCRGQAAMWTGMRVYFLHRHVRDTVIILKEGNLSHPR